jgi:hypothetical protein
VVAEVVPVSVGEGVIAVTWLSASLGVAVGNAAVFEVGVAVGEAATATAAGLDVGVWPSARLALSGGDAA